MQTQANTPATNWGGNYEYRAADIVTPESVEAVQELVRNNRYVKGLGSRHSFNGVADTDGVLISLKNLDAIIGINDAQRTVTLEAGVTYGQLCPYLDEHGYALPNLASLPHITVVGSCMTGTHGSGVNNGNLATSIAAMEFVAADGTLHRVSRDDENFAGLVVGLGAFGIVTSVTLDIVPRFEMWQQLFLELPHSTLLNNYRDIVSSAYSVSLFTTWQHDLIEQVWLKGQADQSPLDSFYDATKATAQLHPIEGGDAVACTEQLDVVGVWYERLPHFRLGFQPSFGREIQSEYFVDIADAAAAIDAVNAVSATFAPHLFISEMRTIAADDLWLSPCYQRQSIAFHFTWKPDLQAVLDALPAIEAQLLPFAVRPHWGKVYTLDADVVRSQYGRADDFADLVRTYDPDGKFGGELLGWLHV